jgi:hypothetical protein
MQDVISVVGLSLGSAAHSGQGPVLWCTLQCTKAPGHLWGHAAWTTVCQKWFENSADAIQLSIIWWSHTICAFTSLSKLVVHNNSCIWSTSYVPDPLLHSLCHHKHAVFEILPAFSWGLISKRGNARESFTNQRGFLHNKQAKHYKLPNLKCSKFRIFLEHRYDATVENSTLSLMSKHSHNRGTLIILSKVFFWLCVNET